MPASRNDNAIARPLADDLPDPVAPMMRTPSQARAIVRWSFLEKLKSRFDKFHGPAESIDSDRRPNARNRVLSTHYSSREAQ